MLEMPVEILFRGRSICSPVVYRAPVRRSQLRFFRLGYEIKPFSVWQSVNGRPNDGLWCAFRRFCEIETCRTPRGIPIPLTLAVLRSRPEGAAYPLKTGKNECVR